MRHTCLNHSVFAIAVLWLCVMLSPVRAESGFVVERVSETPSPGAIPTVVASETPTTDTSFRMEIVRPSPVSHGKRILIYHTHTWEAYTKAESESYETTEKWRTKDNDHNVVAVGRALCAALASLGFEVTHDETAFEPPSLDTSYQRSLSMLERRRGNGEAYDLYIDLHRDAFASASTIQRTVSIGGERVARFMVLVGRGVGYDEKPYYEANQTLAEKITNSLNAQCEHLGRDVKVKTGRFNQHIAPCCVLIECGCNFNTLEEVLCGVPYLARAIEEALADTSPAASVE